MKITRAATSWCILLALTATWWGTCEAHAGEYLVNDGFDLQSVGTVPDGWNESDPDEISGRVSDLFAGSRPNSLRVERIGSCDNLVYHPLSLPAEGQVVTFEFDILVPGSGNKHTFSFVLFLGGDRKLTVISCSAPHCSANVHRIAYGMENGTVLGEFIPETWNHIKIEFDTTTELAAVYYNDQFITVADGDDWSSWNCGPPEPFLIDGDYFGVMKDFIVPSLVYIDNVEVYFGGVCGDGIVDPGEDCDDGNTMAGDGCAAGCTIEHPVPALSLHGALVLVLLSLVTSTALLRMG